MASAAAAMEPSAGVIKLASLAVGEPEDFKDSFDEVEPRADLKSDAAQFPILDDKRKGDPVLGLRPSFESRLMSGGGQALRRDGASPHR